MLLVNSTKNVGAWRSLVARLFRVQEAVSSNLAAPTIFKVLKTACRAVFAILRSKQLFYKSEKTIIVYGLSTELIKPI